jgi:hypothetical protein
MKRLLILSLDLALGILVDANSGGIDYRTGQGICHRADRQPGCGDTVDLLVKAGSRINPGGLRRRLFYK